MAGGQVSPIPRGPRGGCKALYPRRTGPSPARPDSRPVSSKALVFAVFFLLSISLLPSGTVHAETQCLDPCVTVDDLFVESRDNPHDGTTWFTLEAEVTNHAFPEKEVLVRFQAHWNTTQGNGTTHQVNETTRTIPSNTTFTVPANWMKDLTEVDGNITFTASAEIATGKILHRLLRMPSELPYGLFEDLPSHESPRITFDLRDTHGELQWANTTLVHEGAGWRHLAHKHNLTINAGGALQVHVVQTGPANAQVYATLILNVTTSSDDGNRTHSIAIPPPSGDDAPGAPRVPSEEPEPGSRSSLARLIGGLFRGTSMGISPPGHESMEENPKPMGEQGMSEPPTPGETTPEQWIQYVVDTGDWTYSVIAERWPKEWPIPDFDLLGPPSSLPIPDGPDLIIGPDPSRPPGPPPSLLPQSSPAGEPEPESAGSADNPDSQAYGMTAKSSMGKQGAHALRSSMDPGGSSATQGPTGSRSPSDEESSYSDESQTPLSARFTEVASGPANPLVALEMLAGFGAAGLLAAFLFRPEGVLAHWVSKILSGFSFTRLFSRTPGPKSLEFPLRSQIHDAIGKEPGITMSALAKRVGISRSTLRHHLAYLEREGLVLSRSEKKFRHFYLKCHGSHMKEVVGRKAFFYRHRRELAHAILEQPGQMQKELAQNVGLSPSSVCEHLKVLTEAGLVRMENAGRYRRYYPTEALAAVE